jgi:LysM repeat protein
MLEYKIPASITLAQGILESGTGQSHLAVKGNNHFGIKCTDWSGEKMYHDDDLKGECFRVYKNAEESFVDHSLFLKHRSRYSILFDLEVTDYKAWAKGLRKTGYATDPNYSDRLIAIIEDLKLYELDGKTSLPVEARKEKDLKKISDKLDENQIAPTKITINKNPKVYHNAKKHEVFILNKRTQYIVARAGDTYYRISVEFGMHLWELRRYNDFGPRKDVLESGDIIYLTPKSKKSIKKSSLKVNESEVALWSISQTEGIKLKSLEKKNPKLLSDEKLPIGTQVKLK